MAAGGLIPWTEHRSTRTLAGHKQLRRVAVASTGDLTSWDGFVEAAASHGAPDATLWACLIRATDAPPGAPLPGQHPPLGGRLRRPAGLSAPLAQRR